LIQNGVEVEGALRRKLPTATIISGCAWVDATMVENGRLLTQYGPVGVSFNRRVLVLCRRNTSLWELIPFSMENPRKSLLDS
jgi:hypothetical protein